MDKKTFERIRDEPAEPELPQTRDNMNPWVSAGFRPAAFSFGRRDNAAQKHK